MARLRSPSALRVTVAGVIDGFTMLALFEGGRRLSGRPSIFAKADAEPTQDPEAPWRDPGLVVAALVVTVASDLSMDGRTLGRAVTGTRLVDRRGRRPAVRSVMVREAAPYAKTFVLAMTARAVIRGRTRWRVALRLGPSLLLWVLQLRDEQRRSIGDWLARTRVVRNRPH